MLATALFAAPCAQAADVCVISKESGYYASMAKHIVRWLDQQSIKADLALSDSMESALSRSKVAFLLGYSEVSAREMKSIRGFCARGGRIVAAGSGVNAFEKHPNLVGVPAGKSLVEAVLKSR